MPAEINRSGEMEVFVRAIELGGFSAAARVLRIHRTQLRRLLVRHKIDLAKLRDMGQL